MQAAKGQKFWKPNSKSNVAQLQMDMIYLALVFIVSYVDRHDTTVTLQGFQRVTVITGYLPAVFSSRSHM